MAGVLYGASGVAHAGDAPAPSGAAIAAATDAAAADAAASAAADSPQAATAAAAPAGQPPPTGAPVTAAADSLNEVVVTANALQGVRKLDASYSIVAVDAEGIKAANPKSTADLLKVSPGVWPESSGGQTGANIEVAGFPSGGDSPFFTNMIQGLPMYGMPNLSFMDSSSFFRLDDTIERVEVVQGGPSAIFGPGQPGATANFILRRGTAEPSGDISVTWGSENMWRTDGWYGFKIADGWYGSVGGFLRTSSGVRSPQFPADQGGQGTFTISHDLDGGSLMIWGRVLQDKNQFIVPVPVIENQAGDFSAYPGFNPLTSSYGSYATQNVNLPNPAGGFESANLANGRGTNFFFGGINWEQKINDWHFINNFMIDGGGLDTNAFFSGPNPKPLSYYLYACNVPQSAVLCKNGVPQDTNNIFGLTTAGVPTLTSGPFNGAGQPTSGLQPGSVTAAYATTGAAVPLTQDTIQQGWWWIQKSLQNITDEFRASREIFTGNTLTGGVYLARYTMNDNWSLGNQMLMTNTPNATPITLKYSFNGVNYNLSSPQGFVNMNNGGGQFIQHGDAMNIAGFLADSWRLGGWLLDAGVRVENINARQRTCNTTNVQMSTAADLWDNAVPVCNGTDDYEHYIRTMPTYTVGVNYEFSNNFSAYVRVNDGVHFDDFDNGIRGAKGDFAPLETVQNYEGGIKFQNQYAYLDVTAYTRQFHGLKYQPATSTGIPVGEPSTYGSDTHGVNFIASFTPFKGFNLRLVGDWMDGHYTDNVNCLPYTDIFGVAHCANINGAPLQRQPKFQIRATPSYTAAAPWGDATAFVTYEYVGQRYEDLAGLSPLGTYYMLDAGLIFDVGSSWTLRVQGTNLTNQIGLTEGNARVSFAGVGLGGVLLARPIEGREVNITLQYKF